MKNPATRPADEIEASVPTLSALFAYDSGCVEQLVMHFFSIICLPTYGIRALPEEFAAIKNAQEMHNMLWCLREFTAALSKGELEFTCRERGFTVGALKTFQSNLRHLTWQTQRIAAGEYQHRVSFLGDFSVAFNQMTEQLAGRFKTLLRETEEYKDASYKDALTGCYNRNAFSKLAKKFLSQEANTCGSGTLTICDIDHFKKFNDTYGHLCGDAALRAFADKLTSMLRPTDICFRYGGEEFVLVMPNTPLKLGLTVTERLRAAVDAMRIEFEGHELRITASFGLAETTPCETGDDVEAYLTLRLQKADESLYKAKAAGRNCIIADTE